MEIATIAQSVAVISACWAIISGIGAWKRQFIGKRQIELAEQTLAKFFEVKDAIAFIRNPFYREDEGKTRKKDENEPHYVSRLLDQGYIVVERYSKKESIFADFNTLKYRFMASFGSDTEEIFTDTFKVLNSIIESAKRLAHKYWRRYEEEPRRMNNRELDEMHRLEGIFWDYGNEDDEIRTKLNEIQHKIELATGDCFKEPKKTFELFYRSLVSILKESCPNITKKL